ncbi:putative UDP-Gal or UDP-GlcNAc-dependent glycosyltransferase [Trypanosoma cruzi]|nr:putative UDP-Gal or UDP-GlcNAc-dependent glycosyltransferase [Trypanosoma cruzi]
MYCLIGCCIPVCALCAPWPNDVECVIDCSVPPWSVPLPALDPRAGGGCGASGRPLCCAACVLLLGARDEEVRVCAGPSMNDVCESVFFIHFILLIVRLGNGRDSACFFVCVRCLLRLSHSRALTSRWVLAVGSRWECILVCLYDLFVNGTSHGATAVSAGGVAPGVWRVRAVTLAPPPMRPVGGTAPVAHGPCLLTTQLSFFSLLVFSCRRLHSVGAARADGKQTTGGLASGRRTCGGFLRCGGTPPASLRQNVWR